MLPTPFCLDSPGTRIAPGARSRIHRIPDDLLHVSRSSVVSHRLCCAGTCVCTSTVRVPRPGGSYIAAKVRDLGSNVLKCPRGQMRTKPAQVGHVATGAI